MTLQPVHVRVNDAATGQPTPCRLRIVDASGRPYESFGRRCGDQFYAAIDGACEIALPPGTLQVAIDKGPEYVPLRTEVQLIPGKMALRFVIERWTDRKAQGWISGDGRVLSLSPHTALLEAQAQNLGIVNLLALETDESQIENIDAFSGQQPCLEKNGSMVVVNTFNTHPMLGRLALLNCHRPVYPLTFGGPNRTDDWNLAAWCDQCHRKQGLVVWTWGGQEPFGEGLANVILGRIDAFEMDMELESMPMWYRLLNAGLRVPLIGAAAGCAVGYFRTYAALEDMSSSLALRPHADAARLYKCWIEAIRAGRSQVTSGPLLELTVNGRHPGSVIHKVNEPLKINAYASGFEHFGSLEIIVNGQVVVRASGEGQPCEAKLEHELSTSGSGWIAARCSGVAHTSPVYFEHAGGPKFVDPDAAAELDRGLAGSLAWVRNHGRFEQPKSREQLEQIFVQAISRLAATR